MRYLKYTTFVVSASVMLLCGIPAWADGDPTEQAGQLLPDETHVSEDAVATVTADGDFLLPTYLLPGETATVSRTTRVERVYEQQPTTVARAQGQSGSTVASAVPGAEVSLIPVMNDKAAQNVQKMPMQPATAVIPAVRVQVKQPQTPIALGAGHAATPLAACQTPTCPTCPACPAVAGTQTSGTDQAKPTSEQTTAQQTPPKKLLIPLAPVPKQETAEAYLAPKERFVAPSEYADQMTTRLKNGEDLPFLMPHEIRITFYPRVSSFSGQTLKWIRAFATAALQDPRLVVEVRASCAEADLQEERLKLVRAALQGAGLSTHQIVVNYTNRPVDTMLLRAIPRPAASEIVRTTRDKPMPKSMSQITKW